MPAAGPGFTVEIVAIDSLPNGARGPPTAAALELGFCTSPKDLGDPILALETEPDGTARLDLPRSAVPDAPEGKRISLWLRSQGVGLLTRTDFEPVPKDDGHTVKLVVTVQPGTVVEGRLLGPDGQPAAGKVDWWFFGEDGVTSSHVGTAGPDGLFRGELRYEGLHGLLASGTSTPDDGFGSYYTPEQLDLGTGFSETFVVDFDEPVPFIEVQVSGPGVLHGRVLDAGGGPAAGVQLVTVLAELDDEDGSLRFPYPRTRDLQRQGGGLLWVRATTDAEGAFAMHGLRRDVYNVRAADVGVSSSGYPVLLTEHAVPADGAPLELRLSRPHLAIHVRTPEGTPPDGELEVHRGGRWTSTLEGWPEEPGLLVTLAPGYARLGGVEGAYLDAVSTAPGEFIVELDGDMRVAESLELHVGVLGGDLPWRPEHVVVPPGAGRVDVDVVMPRPEPPGSVLLDVMDAAGAALVDGLRVRVIDPATGTVLVDRPCDDTDADDWPLRIPLPEGEHGLLVEGHPNLDSHHGTLQRRRAHGAHEQTVLVTAGVETHVTAMLGEAARLSVHVVGAPDEADRDAALARYANPVADKDIESWARRVSMRLEREGRWPEAPWFARRAMENTSAAGTHLFSAAMFGEEETSEPITPGAYTLVATTMGGREVRQAVTLLPGQTLPVTLRFD